MAKAQTVTYIKRNVPLLTVLTEIQRQTGYSIAWNEGRVDVNRLIDANFINTSLTVVLDQLIVGQPLEYQISGKSVALRPKKPLVPLVAEKILGLDTSMFLQEVAIVSTGYQRIPINRATGSYVPVDPVQFNRKVSLDVLNRLEGITSGLLFNRNTQASNAGNLDLSIRGRSTIYANDQPLIVLDNFPYSGDFNSINPNDVESITILKDAAAAAIWGVRAGNGVIVATTHRGKIAQPVKVVFNTNFSIAQKPNLNYNPNYMSASDFIDQEISLFNSGKYDNALADVVNFPPISAVVKSLNRQRQGLQTALETGRQIDALRNNDIRKEELKYFYRNAVSQQYAVSLAGGTNKSSHYFSTGFDHMYESLKENSNNRVTINSQNTFQFFKQLALEAGLNYVRSASKIDSTLSDAVMTNRAAPYFKFKDITGDAAAINADFSDEYKKAAVANGFLDWMYRPLEELGKFPTRYAANDIRFNTGLRYMIIPGLTTIVKYQFQGIENKREQYNGIESYFTRNLINQFSVTTNGKVTGYNIPVGAISRVSNVKSIGHNTRFQLDYEKQWGENQLTALAGYEFSSFNVDIERELTYAGEIDEESTFPLNPSGAGSLLNNDPTFGRVDRIRSIYGTALYSYRGKYLISGSARTDGSNYFGVHTNQKYVPLWSAGAAWKLSRENFYSLTWLPLLNVKVSYGYNGNLDKSITGVTTIIRSLPTIANITNLPYAIMLNVGNPDLRWEKIGIANFGLNFGLKNQIVTGSIEYFHKNGTGILGDQTFPTSSGIRSLRGNYAEMIGNGLDFSVNTNNLSGRLKWRSSILFSTVKDEVTRYGIIQLKSVNYVGIQSSAPAIGKPVYGIYSYRSAGLDESTADYKFIIENTKQDDLIYHGTSRPTHFGSIINSVAIDKFTLSINVSYKFGYYFRKSVADYFSSYSANTFKDTFYNNSEQTVASGDHIRLQDISLDFNAGKLKFYCYANNLGLLWKANKFGLDPDIIPYRQNTLMYPSPVSISFGVKGNL